MKISYLKLQTELNMNIGYKLNIDKDVIDSIPGLISLVNTKVSGAIYFDDGNAICNLTIKGEMIVPCANTLEPINHKFKIDYNPVFTFEDHDDADFVIKTGEFELDDYIYTEIRSSIPLLKSKKVTNREGSNWAVLTEEELKNNKPSPFDILKKK